MNAITVTNLSKSYEDKQLFSHLSFEIPQGGVYAILGPSGCGKTTLFRLLSGLETPDEGEIVLAAQARVAYMFQEPRLLPTATVYQNLACLFSKNTIVKEEIFEWLDRVGLQGCERLYPDQLSGGMRTRVSLARALCYNPDILLLDEPFNGLDVKTRDEMIALVLRYTKDKTVLMITHQKEEVKKMGAIEITLPFLQSKTNS